MPHTGHEVVAAPGSSNVAATHQGRQQPTNTPADDSYDAEIDNGTGSTDDDGYHDEGPRG